MRGDNGERQWRWMLLAVFASCTPPELFIGDAWLHTQPFQVAKCVACNSCIQALATFYLYVFKRELSCNICRRDIYLYVFKRELSCNICRRDIKASNILLSKEGIAKIADVGLATTVRHILAPSPQHFSWSIVFNPQSFFGSSCYILTRNASAVSNILLCGDECVAIPSTHELRKSLAGWLQANVFTAGSTQGTWCASVLLARVNLAEYFGDRLFCEIVQLS